MHRVVDVMTVFRCNTTKHFMLSSNHTRDALGAQASTSALNAGDDHYGMPFYPLPALVALTGWIYVAATPGQRQFVGTAGILLLLGLAAYFLRARVVRSWPFGPGIKAS